MDQANGGSKKGLYIVIGILAVIVLGFLLRNSFGKSQMYGVNVSKHLDGSTTYNSDYGTTTINNNKWPDNWPTDVPKYNNSTVTTAGSTNAQAGIEGYEVMFNTSDNAQAVLDFYKSGLTASGWTSQYGGKAITGTQVGGMISLSAKKDKRSVMFAVSDIGNGQSKVTIIVTTMPDVKTGL
jgi:hypothetical protein